jgi:N-acetylmuramoyl-L-alanine amidase
MNPPRPGKKRRRHDLPGMAAVVGLSGIAAIVVGCGSGHPAGAPTRPATPTGAATAAPSTADSPTTQSTRPPSAPTTPPVPAAPRTVTTAAVPSRSTITTASTPDAPRSTGELAGKVITIDPGHNGANYTDPGYIDAPVWNGRESEACDTTGTQTDSGYTEAQFNWNVAQYVAADLRSLGAIVILTRSSNSGIGPCITQRTAIGNDAHANAAVSIHADGGPPSGRGFAILEPVPDGPNDAVIATSQALGNDLRAAFLAGTGEPVSDYSGVDGIVPRNDLAGVNLTTVPKVFIECANMRNAQDAALVTNAEWQMKAAQSIANGIATFVASP